MENCFLTGKIIIHLMFFFLFLSESKWDVGESVKECVCDSVLFHTNCLKISQPIDSQMTSIPRVSLPHITSCSRSLAPFQTPLICPVCCYTDSKMKRILTDLKRSTLTTDYNRVWHLHAAKAITQYSIKHGQNTQKMVCFLLF